MTTEAWFLHKYPSGDTSAQLSLFTREKGIVTCLYKGARTAKKQSLLQPFIPLWLSLDSKKDWHFVRHLETLSTPLIFKNQTLFAALYVNELIHYALKPLDPHPELYEAYQYTLQGLTAVSERLAIESLLRQFEWMLLRECGYRLAIIDDALSSKANSCNPYYRYIVGKGFIAASTGFAREDILAITQGQFNEVRILKVAKLIMRQAIHHLLGGRELKSRSLFNPIVKTGL
jgi:DNA repair protein RecO (recombination protein O)